MSGRQRSQITGMLVIKRQLIDNGADTERLARWIAQSVEVLLECELERQGGDIRDAVSTSLNPSSSKTGD